MLRDQLVLLGIATQLLNPSLEPGGWIPPMGFSATSFQVDEVRAGTGPAVREGDRVTLHFAVADLDGEEIANSLKRGLPYSFVLKKEDELSQLVIGMRVGGIRKAEVGPNMFNNGEGIPPILPARRALRLELRLLRAVRASE